MLLKLTRDRLDEKLVTDSLFCVQVIGQHCRRCSTVIVGTLEWRWRSSYDAKLFTTSSTLLYRAASSPYCQSSPSSCHRRAVNASESVRIQHCLTSPVSTPTAAKTHTRAYNKSRETCAIAKMTTRCALYVGDLKIFGTSWLRPRLLFPRFLWAFVPIETMNVHKNLKSVALPDYEIIGGTQKCGQSL